MSPLESPLIGTTRLNPISRLVPPRPETAQLALREPRFQNAVK